jgi:hypothetical protein
MTPRTSLTVAALLPAALIVSANALAQIFTTPAVPPSAGQPSSQQPQIVAPATPVNPVCSRLEAQLAAVDRGAGDPGRVAQIQRADDALNRQQAALDRLVAQSRRLGCQTGFFSIFSSQPPQCSSLNTQIEQARSGVDRSMMELQRLQSGGAGEQEAQRQTVLTALAQNNCGPQYRQAAAPQQGGLFQNLFGGGGNSGFGGNPMFGGVDVSQGGTFRTLCVRTCDGYYYPISFATTPARFADDEATCRATCPNAEVMLFAHRTNEDVRQATSINGRLYTDLPTAFRYRTNYDSSCSCRKVGQSWADALGGNRDNTVERGDIVVTDEKARQMSQPKADPRARQPSGATTQPAATASTPANNVDQRSIRTIGPAPYPVR